MKHLGAIFFALLCAGVAIYLLVTARPCGLTGGDRWMIGGGLVLAIAIPVPASFKDAAATLAQYVPLVKKSSGGS